MELGLGVLGLAPTVFWALTPRELESILRGRAGKHRSLAPPSRADLDSLMQLFPDQG